MKEFKWYWDNEFNKKFIGQWRREDGAKILSVWQNEDKSVEVKVHQPPHSYNFTAKYIEWDNESLNFFNQDRYNRAEYILTFINDDLLRCEFTQVDFTNEPVIRNYERISHAPYDMMPPVELKEARRIEILREYAGYGEESSGVKFKFKFDERENLLDIIEKYNLDKLVEGKNDVETAIALLGFVCDNYKHNGGAMIPNDAVTVHAIMDYCDKNDSKTNCYGLSMMLAQLIRIYTLKAFHIRCMPYEQPFSDCHVVVSVYCESLNKWIMLDPTNRLYLKNKFGEIVGIHELRDILIEDDKLFANDDANWNGNPFNLEDYREYMTKNLIRLERGIAEFYGSDMQDGCVILIPDKYMQNEAKNFDEEVQKNFISSERDFWEI